jgi:hypothetical protein
LDIDEAGPRSEELEEETSETPESLRERKIRLAREYWLEILSVVILSVASLAAAWSGYQSAGWSGEQARLHDEATNARMDSMKYTLIAQQLFLLDLEKFNLYAIAVAGGNTALAGFQVRQFRDEFQPAFDAWLALDPLNNPDAPASPLLMPEYQSPESEEAERLSEVSEQLVEEGHEASETSDEYILTTVFLAAVLFFVGISSRINWLPARTALVAVGVVMLIFALVELARLPEV